jgi:hypothetical protein
MCVAGQERDEIAICAMGNKVKVWDVKRPANPKLKLVLNHGQSVRLQNLLPYTPQK